MATEQEQNNIEDISNGLSSIINVLRQQAKDLTIDIGDVTEVAIGKIISTPAELIESLDLPTIAQAITPAIPRLPAPATPIAQAITPALRTASMATPATRAITALTTVAPAIASSIAPAPAIPRLPAIAQAITRTIPRLPAPATPRLPAPATPRLPAPATPRLPAPATPRSRQDTASPIIPNVEGIFKGLLFGIVPNVVIKAYTSKIKYLVTELGKIPVPEQNLKELVDPLAKVSDAVVSFSQISWAKAFVSIKALQFFTKIFSSSINKIATPENLKSLSLFEKFSKKLSEPLTNISESLNEFANISWAKVLIGTKLFSAFIKGVSKVPLDSIKSVANVFKKLASGLKAPLESLGNTLEKFGDSLNKFVGPLIKGAVAIALLGASLVPLAYGLKMFADVDISSILKATVALGGLVALAKVLGGSIGPILKGAGAIALLGVSILPLAYSLKLMESVGIGTIGVLAAALTTLGLAAAAVGTFAPLIAIGAGVIALLGASIIPLAFGLKMLSEADPETLSALILPMLGLAGAGLALLVGAPGLMLAGFALIPFALGIKALSFALEGLDVDVLKALPMSLIGLAGAALALAVSAPALLIAGLALIPFALGVKALSAAIEGVNVDVLKALPGALIGLADAASELAWSSLSLAIAGGALVPFAGGIKALSMAIDGLNTDTLKALPDALSGLASAALDIAKAAPALVISGLALIPFSVGVATLGLAVKVGGEGLIAFMDKMGEFTKNLDPAKLFASAGAIVALSGAIAAFGAAQAAEGLGNLVGRFLRFGADSPLEQMQKFAAIGDQLKSAGEGILNLSNGISKLSSLGSDIEVLDNFPWDELENLAKAIEGKAIIQIVTGGGLESKGGMVEAATGKSLGAPSREVDYSTMSDEEKAKAAGYSSFEEYKDSGWKWKGKTEESAIMSAPSTVGAELAASGVVGGAAPIIINNNNGGNVSTVSNSNVNNSPTPVAPILTGSALGFV
jgi:hypothetical protein